MDKENMKEEKKNNIEVDKLAYKIIFEDEVFKMGFAKMDCKNEKLEVLYEFELNEEEFKGYLIHMLKAVVDFNNKKGRNMIEELFEN